MRELLASMLSLATASQSRSVRPSRAWRGSNCSSSRATQVVDVIEPGDLLTVVDEDEQAYYRDHLSGPARSREQGERSQTG